MDLSEFYGKGYDKAAAEKRIDDLAKKFKKGENTMPEYFFSSSGRAEILGNHTDHNHGLVLVAAISCDILAAVKKTDNNVARVYSEGYMPITVNLDDLEKKPRENGTSTALVRGVAAAIKQRNLSIGGFTAYITSNVFKGAGVSSSAAFEVLIAEIFNKLYLDGKLTAVDKAVISQYSENVYFGKPCGLLDQSGIAIGSLSKLDFLVPTEPKIEKLGNISGYTLVITNTGGDHALLTPHYAAIRSDMESVAAFFGKKVLREVGYDEFYRSIDQLMKKFDGRAILRALHFYEENERVEQAAKAIREGDYSSLISAIERSGLSSLNKLQNCFVPADLKQPVVLGIELSRRIIKDGAVRVHGGGFAGSILAVVADGEAESYMQTMKKWFGEESVFAAHIRNVGTTQMA
ncbi:MAG: galactokinase [Clostridia bacterium]|nr:galactokinase [Clostridia bacterium]